MLFILFAWIYISLLCWAWGYALIGLFARFTPAVTHTTPSFYIVCFSGFSIVTVTSGLLSLFIPLGGIAAQLMLLIPATVIAAQKKTRVQLLADLKNLVAGQHPVILLLTASLLSMLLILGASVINHPDSIGYHLQTIKWIEEYRVVPGLVNINTHLGYQGLWYCVCAVFSFRFMQGTAVTFVNTTVLVWYLMFLLQQINTHLPNAAKAKPGNASTVVLYFALLVFSCWSYVQVRLTATSASPDFIAALYAWLVLYLLFHNTGTNKSVPNYLLIFFLCCTAITIKLAVLPLCMVMAYIFYQLLTIKKKPVIGLLLTCILVTATPFVTRNVITSGYILFPAAFPDLVQADWKLPAALAVSEQQYISSFARVEHEALKPGASQLSMTHWMPIWWHHRALSDKLILCSLLLLLLTAVITARKIRKEAGQACILLLLLSAAALVFWFVQAPDPRFGFGFIIPVQGALLSFYAGTYINKIKNIKTGLLISILLFTCIITGYIVYRASHYFNQQYIIAPAGAQKVNYKTVNCGKFTFTMPVEGGCGNAPLPCIYNNCAHFAARGNSMADGFRYK